MSPVRGTSIEAYRSLEDLGQRQRAVFELIRDHGPLTNLDIADGLGLPVNQVTPRTNELVKLGIVGEAFRAPSAQTGRRSIFWQHSHTHTTSGEK